MIPLDEGFPSQTLVRMPVETVSCLQQLPFCRSLYAADIGHYPEARNHLVKRDQGCPNHILIYCIGGQGWYSLNGEKRIPVQAGQAILIPAKSPHAYGSTEGQSWRLYWIHFSGTEADGLFNFLSDERTNALIYLPHHASIITAFEDAIRWTQREHSKSVLHAFAGSCSRLLGIIAEGKRPNSSRARFVEERVRSTITRMRETLRSPLSLEQLASEACLSVPHYSALFKKQTSSSPIQMYSQMRIQLACELLHNTDLGIKEVAETAGYEDAYYFSRAFKKVMGCPPSAYRNSLDKRQRDPSE
ncbi:transcriptional regulator, AraC family protein [Verrucomicrobiia bacterium DG1235]|nr:transcriptional regulator, AraC family protein [Verrucomicrobiae bacterium DG1235]